MAQENVPELVDGLFRSESARLIGALTRLLGLRNLEAAEEIAQEALLAALQAWPYAGQVDNPSAWLTRVARNKAIDFIRRERHRRRFAEEHAASLASEYTLARSVDAVLPADSIEDDQLRLIFACCHPALPDTSRIALTLRILCGLTASEIARAFMTTEAAILKRLTRAREQLGRGEVPFGIPEGAELAERLDAVLAVLYLLFNEGYASSRADEPIRRDLCREALRRALALSRHPRTRAPRVDALVALMCLHSARLPARLGDDGALVLMEQQDRGLWDRQLIARGLQYLDAASSGERISRYHLEAAIAACHCQAASFAETPWRRLLDLYDMLLEAHPSPVVALNRAIAAGHVEGPAAAIEQISRLEARGDLAGYYLLPAALGEFLLRARDRARAADCFSRALELAPSAAEKELLRRRLESSRG